MFLCVQYYFCQSVHLIIHQIQQHSVYCSEQYILLVHRFYPFIIHNYLYFLCNFIQTFKNKQTMYIFNSEIFRN